MEQNSFIFRYYFAIAAFPRELHLIKLITIDVRLDTLSCLNSPYYIEPVLPDHKQIITFIDR